MVKYICDCDIDDTFNFNGNLVTIKGELHKILRGDSKGIYVVPITYSQLGGDIND